MMQSKFIIFSINLNIFSHLCSKERQFSNQRESFRKIFARSKINQFFSFVSVGICVKGPALSRKFQRTAITFTAVEKDTP